MNYLAQALTLPKYGTINGLLPDNRFTNLGSLVGGFLDLFLILAAFLAFIMLLYGALCYIFAGGDKQGIAAARQRMIYAIVGLIVVAVAYLAAQFIEQILVPSKPSPLSLVQTVYAQNSRTSLSNQYDFGWYQSLGQFVSQLLPTLFSIAALGVVFYFLFGAFKYLTAAGNKEAVSSARGMITHSIVGFIILMMVFLVMQFLPNFLGIDLNIFAI